ncbi:hypothetical protein PIB30_040325 [Stylosanthes scabra]|uniref:Uncharacterized protein n=1 Tax=Stylosanthes scabra TaxID=79078 RepID=A0ABU6SEX4_9FABA|nr:hypothetical protein [Stylosanthes scabra]
MRLLLCFGDGILTLFKYLGYFYETCFVGGSYGLLWTGSMTFDSERTILGLSLRSFSLSFSILLYDASTLRWCALQPPRPAVSPSSSASSGLSDRVSRERERSPRALLPSHVPAPALALVYPPPRVPMMDARRYRNLFPRRRVIPPTPPPSDDDPSDDDDALSSRDVSSADISYELEHESTSFSSGSSDLSSSGSSSSNDSFGYGFGSGGSSSDASSEDDLANRYFSGTFPPSMR